VRAGTSPALLLNRRGGRLPVRGASTIIQSTVGNAGLGDGITAHAGRHIFATARVRGGTALVVVADLLGHARLDTVRACTRPPEDDRTKGPQPALHRPLTSETSTACPDSGVSGRYLHQGVAGAHRGRGQGLAQAGPARVVPVRPLSK